MPLNGSLDDYSPAGALRVLSSTGKTGAVRFSGEAGCTVYLHNGQLYFARDETTDQALATALVRTERLSAEAWSAAIEEAGDEPRVGEILANNGTIDPDLLASVALSVFYDPLIRLFREGDGSFDFEPDTVHWLGPFRTFNVDAIVNEVRRRVREIDEMSPLVPSIDSWVATRPTLPGSAQQVTLLREDWELVTLLHGPRSIVDLAYDMGRGRYSTARVIHRLAAAGLVEIVPAPASETAATEVEVNSTDEPQSETGSDNPTDLVPPDDLSELEGIFNNESWSTSELGWDQPDDRPGGLGNGLEPHPSVSEPGEDSAWGLPHRQPVAVQTDGEGGLALRNYADSLQQNGTPGGEPIPGLEGINGFRSAIGEEATAAATSSTKTELHPNAVWLETLYADYMDVPEVQTKKRKETLDVAFGASHQDSGAKVGTLRRLMDALKKL